MLKNIPDFMFIGLFRIFENFLYIAFSIVRKRYRVYTISILMLTFYLFNETNWHNHQDFTTIFLSSIPKCSTIMFLVDWYSLRFLLDFFGTCWRILFGEDFGRCVFLRG